MKTVESTINEDDPSVKIPLEAHLLANSASCWPLWLIWSAVGVCLVPFVLTILGADFGSTKSDFDPAKLSQLTQAKQVEFFHQTLSGSFTQTILESTAISVAMFTAFLACMRLVFNRRDYVTPIVGLTFLFSGFMDAFHTLTADRLLTGAADPTNLEPFTWLISRIFNIVIVSVGVGTALFYRKKDKEFPMFYVASASIALSFLAFGVMYVSMHTASLPQMMYPDAFLKRPYDVIPLILYLPAGILLFRLLWKMAPSCFSFGLMLSLLPLALTQMHMVFGSAAMFDNHFVVAHFLRILGYFFPLIGLVLDYNYSFVSRKEFYKAIEKNNILLGEEIKAHEKTEKDLRFNEARIRGIIDSATDAFVTMDEWGDITSINEAAEKMFDVTPEEVLGKQIKVVVEKFQSNSPLDEQSNSEMAQMDFFKCGKEGVGRKKDGTLFPIEISMSEVECGDQYIFNCIARDITDRKRVEIEFRKYTLDVEMSQRLMEEQGVYLNELSEEFFEMRNKLQLANMKKQEILKEIQRDLKIPIGTFLDPGSVLYDEFHQSEINTENG